MKGSCISPVTSDSVGTNEQNVSNRQELEPLSRGTQVETLTLPMGPGTSGVSADSLPPHANDLHAAC